MAQRVNEKVLADTGMVQIIRRWTGKRQTYSKVGRLKKRRKGGK